LISAPKRGLYSQRRSRPDAKLVVDVMHVNLDSGFADEQQLRDLPVWQSLTQKVEDISLAGG
jgi:hypothetical protein